MQRKEVDGNGFLLIYNEFLGLVNHQIRIQLRIFSIFYNFKADCHSLAAQFVQFRPRSSMDYRETIILLFTHPLSYVTCLQQQVNSQFFLSSLKSGLTSEISQDKIYVHMPRMSAATVVGMPSLHPPDGCITFS